MRAVRKERAKEIYGKRRDDDIAPFIPQLKVDRWECTKCLSSIYHFMQLLLPTDDDLARDE